MNTRPSAPARKRLAWLAPALIVIVFAGPMIAAWLTVQQKDLRPAGSVVNGNLVHPARPLDGLPLQRLDGSDLEMAELKGRWTLLYIDGSDCNAVCERSLYNMRQTRLALNEDALRVQRVLVLTDGKVSEPLQVTLEAHPDLTVAAARPGSLSELLGQFHVTQGDDPGREQRIYTLDPLGNLIIFYEPGVDPKGILKDLERLLKASHIG